MAVKKIKLANIVPGEYLSWFATTQAQFSITMKLYDNKKIYFEGTRQNRRIEDLPLSQGSAQYIGENLTLEVNIPDSREILTYLYPFELVTPNKANIGHGFTCCGEDQDDEDFNDFYLNVMGWKNKG